MALPQTAMGLTKNCGTVQFGFLIVVAVAMATSRSSADTPMVASPSHLLDAHERFSSKGHDGFACAAGASDWELGWSAEKRSWCCRKSRVWCNNTDLLYDCRGEAEAWPVERAAWCCSRKTLGCARLSILIGKSSSPSPLLHQCNEDPWDWEMVWSFEKRAWCCKHHNVGCHPPEGSKQLAAAGVSKVPRRWDCRLAVAAAAAAVFQRQGDSGWSWADPTRDQCCQKHGLGCRDSTTQPPPAQVIGFTAGHRQDDVSAHSTVNEATVSWLPYDCHAGLKNVRAAWDDGKKCWCCRHEDLGCEEAKDTRECHGLQGTVPLTPSTTAAKGRNGHTSHTTTESSAGHSTTLAEEVPAGTTPQLPALFNPCLQRSAAYSPDMLGTSITMETGIWECQLRCARVIGCAHFSYWTMGGYCHIQDAKAKLVRNLLPQVIAGPAKCGTDSDSNSNEKAADECFELATAYFPILAGHSRDFGERHGVSAQGVMRQCREHCVRVAECEHFVVQFPQRTCNLAGVSARRLVRYQAVSGPRSCTATMTATGTTQDKESSVLPTGGGIWQGKFDDSQGHQRSPSTSTAGIQTVLRSILPTIGVAAGVAGLLCVVGFWAASSKRQLLPAGRSRLSTRHTLVDGKRPVSWASRLSIPWLLLTHRGPNGASDGSEASGPGRPLPNYLYAAL